MRTPWSRRRLLLFLATSYYVITFLEAFQSILRLTHTLRTAPLYGSVLTDGSASSDSLTASESGISEAVTFPQTTLSDQLPTSVHLNLQQDAHPVPVTDSPTAAEGPPVLPLNATTSGIAASEMSSPELSRRKWLQIGTMFLGGAVAISLNTFENNHQIQERTTTGKPSPKKALTPSTVQKKLQRIQVGDIFRETNINLTMECTTTCVSLDRYTFEKKASLKLPRWVPSYLVPPPRTIRKMSDTEILIAAIVAGSTVEMARTSILYPILTLKSRIQGDIKKRVRTRLRRGNTRRLHPRRRAKILRLNIVRHFREGKLYAGLVPSLLVSVPAAGVYYGVRDVVRRFFNSLPGIGDVTVAVSAALVADVVSLMIRTPADTLAIRLQVATGKQQHIKDRVETTTEEMAGNWFVESLERLPAVILTDLPYLLSRTALNRYLIHGNVDFGHYELTMISTALLCGFLTTPFDAARTRILLDSDDDPTNGIDGGSGAGLITTMRTVVREGEGGAANLFAGWLERTIYLGVGRAWLEPLQILGYMAIRDAILLEWFD